MATAILCEGGGKITVPYIVLYLAAVSLLGSVILGLPAAAFKGPRTDYFAKLLKFPTTHEFAIAIAVGCPDGAKEAHPVEDGRIDYVRARP